MNKREMQVWNGVTEVEAESMIHDRLPVFTKLQKVGIVFALAIVAVGFILILTCPAIRVYDVSEFDTLTMEDGKFTEDVPLISADDNAAAAGVILAMVGVIIGVFSALRTSKSIKQARENAMNEWKHTGKLPLFKIEKNIIYHELPVKGGS